MSADPYAELQRSALRHLAQMTATLAAKAFARAEAVEGVAFAQATEVFCDLGWSLRLTISLDLRLAAFARAAARPPQPARMRAEASDAETAAEAPDSRHQPDALERERDGEHDGFPMDPLGRISALETVIARAPDLDPDDRVGAQIIQLRAFLTEPDPPPSPSGPLPIGPAPPASALGRPPNRAERRRERRRSSG